MVPVGHQLAGDERQHLGLRPVLGEIQRVEGRRDGGSRLQLRVGLAAGVGVRFDEDGVVEVLEGRRERAGHGQVAQDVRALHKVEGRPAGPGLAVPQGHGQEGSAMSWVVAAVSL